MTTYYSDLPPIKLVVGDMWISKTGMYRAVYSNDKSIWERI